MRAMHIIAGTVAMIGVTMALYDKPISSAGGSAEGV